MKSTIFSTLKRHFVPIILPGILIFFVSLVVFAPGDIVKSALLALVIAAALHFMKVGEDDKARPVAHTRRTTR